MGRIRKKIPKKVENYFCSVISGIKSQTPRFIHGCNRPKSLPSSGGRLNQNHHVAEFDLASASATLDDIDRYLFENFRSLYGETERETEEEAPEHDDARTSLEIQLPALIDLRRSNRFFITPVSSGSLIEEARLKLDYSGSESFKFAALRIDCVPVVTVSCSPYDDFLRSMADVVNNAGLKQGGGVDWEFMEKLLFWYLRLNEEEHYMYVVKAFVDLVVDSRRSYGGDPGLFPPYCE